MDVLYILLIIIAVIATVSLITSYICFSMIFKVSKKMRQEYRDTEFPIPVGEIYEPYRERMTVWIKNLQTLPHDDIEIKSFDGLTLRGKYYECAPGATMEILFHGYKGSSKRDLCGGVARCFALGRNALIVDHRGSGESDGKVITFGINERRDALKWVEYAVNRFGKDVKIILTGISMGAATVMMVSSEKLPENVIGVLADCGYTSAKDIIKKVIRDMKLPADILYPFVRLGARIYGRFNIDETSPIEELKRSRIPVLFIHGESDDFVPCEMSKRNYDACATRKEFVTVPGAGHGVCYVVDKEKYLSALRSFFDEAEN